MVAIGMLLFKTVSLFVDTHDPFDSGFFYWAIILPTVVLGLFAGWLSDIPVSLWWISLALGILSMSFGNLWPLTLILLLIMLAPSALTLYLSRIVRNRLVREKPMSSE